MIPVLSSDAHVFKLLTEDNAMRDLFPDRKVQLFNDVAPRDTADIFVVFQTPNIMSVSAMEGEEFMTNIDYTLIVVGKRKPFAVLAPYYERAHQIINTSGWSTSLGANVGRYIRTGHLKYGDEVDGVTYNYLGGMYKTYVSAV